MRVNSRLAATTARSPPARTSTAPDVVIVSISAPPESGGALNVVVWRGSPLLGWFRQVGEGRGRRRSGERVPAEPRLAPSPVPQGPLRRGGGEKNFGSLRRFPGEHHRPPRHPPPAQFA